MNLLPQGQTIDARYINVQDKVVSYIETNQVSFGHDVPHLIS